MKNETFLFLLLLILTGCQDDPVFKLNKIKGLKFYNESNELVSEYKYGYDSEGRLNYKTSVLATENIYYLNQFISVWNIKFDSGEKIESYYYNQERLDSISNKYVYPRVGLDLITFSYENNKCVSKTEIKNRGIKNVYKFIYNDDYVSQIILVQKQQNDTLHYIYEYDSSGNVKEILLDGLIHSDFEYTSIENPLFKVSKPYLTKTPIHPNQGENESITSKYLLRKANYYDRNGNLETEISIQYSLNDDGLPISAVRTYNGLKQEIKYEYQ